MGTNIWKCLVWSLNTAPWTHSVWRNELRVAVELGSKRRNFTVLHMQFSEIKVLRGIIITRKMKNKKMKIFATSNDTMSYTYYTKHLTCNLIPLNLWFFISRNVTFRTKILITRLLSSRATQINSSKTNMFMVRPLVTTQNIFECWFIPKKFFLFPLSSLEICSINYVKFCIMPM
jgi:hypothetical protein